MAGPLPEKYIEELRFFQHHNKLLTSIREHSLWDPEVQNPSFIFQHCCNTIKNAFECSFVWAGDIDREQCRLSLFASSPPASPQDSSIQHYLAGLLIRKFKCDLSTFVEPLYLYLDAEEAGQFTTDNHYCLAWPVAYKQHTYGFVVMHCRQKETICELKTELITPVIDDIALALYSRDTALKLRVERDYNKEIIDTIQALMVTISPCGTIISFNRIAEKVTGYTERETVGKYWVDILSDPENRQAFQQIFSDTLKGDQANINFRAPLLSKDGSARYINWHGSIRHNIETGKVGLVMLGIDETENMAADQQLHMLTARWEKIFNAIQDPVLVVSGDNTILDANPATCAAAKKKRAEVIGQKVCAILHGGHGGGNDCPLEEFIGYQKTRITETELHGLHGTYMLTVSPLIEENGEINATLLVARNLTQEEVVRAEAIRVSQLVAIGELASGVAHEINNPINTIINYAQIILDDPQDLNAADSLQNIINESKRIAGIVSNLLDFARCREEVLALADMRTIIENSLQLVAHLLKKDGITCTVNIPKYLPPLLCDSQQLQQVALNLISNARYALNSRYPEPCAEKCLKIDVDTVEQGEGTFIQLVFTDYGIGIASENLERLFDPFFSTKPKGEGTGLGLSISHGLVREHGGYIKAQSNPGEWTRFIVELPVRSC
jgi:PAS domain S-box-containing protein